MLLLLSSSGFGCNSRRVSAGFSASSRLCTRKQTILSPMLYSQHFLIHEQGSARWRSLATVPLTRTRQAALPEPHIVGPIGSATQALGTGIISFPVCSRQSFLTAAACRIRPSFDLHPLSSYSSIPKLASSSLDQMGYVCVVADSICAVYTSGG